MRVAPAIARLTVDERGSVSILVASIAVVLVVLSMGVADVARVLVAAARAQAAADAAALAAAQGLALSEAEPAPSDLAGTYARLNGATLETCECEPGTFAATVSVRYPIGDLFLFAGDRGVVARARAEVDLPTLKPFARGPPPTSGPRCTMPRPWPCDNGSRSSEAAAICWRRWTTRSPSAP